jgi:alkanesulfonate monooxygenase SsuD/methylene tetrahydromethanopterin reductase-like flavin-dependent oxidoreductase (luciferase family)
MFLDTDAAAAQQTRVREACTAIDRDPDAMGWSAALVTCVGADQAEFERRAAALGRDPDQLRTAGIAGTPDQAIEAAQAWAAIGSDRLCLQILDLDDLDHLDLIAESVAPHL